MESVNIHWINFKSNDKEKADELKPFIINAWEVQPANKQNWPNTCAGSIKKVREDDHFCYQERKTKRFS